MIEVVFCARDQISDELLVFAVIIARYKEKFVFCRHNERCTWEVPGGHREFGESIGDAAKRELYEETGAVDYDITPITVYGVKSGDETTYGMLFYADIKKLTELPAEYEIAEIIMCDTMPEQLTYPEIQPRLWEYVRKEMKID